MSAIKNHYHEEICEMMFQGESLSEHVERVEEVERLEEMIAEYESDREEVEHSGVPSYFSSKF